MKKITFFLVALILIGCTKLDLPVQFEDLDFKAYCISNFDTNGDGVVSQTEAATVTHIDVSRCNISSLRGVEFFINLLVLDCSDNQLTDLDVSKNPALTSVICNRNSLIRLDFSNN